MTHIGKQAEIRHNDWPIYRNRRGWPRWYQPIVEAWLVLTGRWSLHRAWQNGLDAGHREEYRRLITNKAYIAESAIPRLADGGAEE